MNRRNACLYWSVLAMIVLGAVLWPVGADEPRRESKKELKKADIDEMMTSLSNWGRWGKDDQRGALNLITAEKRKQAAALVKDGVTVSMAHPVIKEEVETS